MVTKDSDRLLKEFFNQIQLEAVFHPHPRLRAARCGAIETPFLRASVAGAIIKGSWDLLYNYVMRARPLRDDGYSCVLARGVKSDTWKLQQYLAKWPNTLFAAQYIGRIAPVI
jgi:hypothetical protein